MNEQQNNPTLLFLRKMAPYAWAVLLGLMPFPAVSALNKTAIHQAVVRVEANGNFASGFVFGGPNQVVTSLHAILPPPPKIEIYCKGNAVAAKVINFVKDTDLVLLEATTSLEKLGCKPYPEKALNSAPPQPGEDLAAYGFRGDNRRLSFAKFIKKGDSPPPETLERLVPDTAVQNVRDLGMPRHDLPLYLISGGLYPGLSGGPVFKLSSGELVGIVEGGLDAGVSNHAWLVPAVNLKQLLASPYNSQLPHIDPSKYGYSSPSARRTATNTIEYKDPDSSYRWVKTKSRSFEQLVNSADDSEGLGGLIVDLYPKIADPAGQQAVYQSMLAMRFDIYEEADHGLIVAVPEGQSLKVESYDDGYHFLAVENQAEDAIFTVDFGSHKILSVEDEAGITVDPTEDRYLTQALDQWMYNYCDDADLPCFYDETSASVVDFGQTRKLLRFFYHTEESEGSQLIAMYIHSINMLVNGAKIMQVSSTTNLNENSAALQCWATLTAETCGKPYWDQVSLMLAARLSSFTNLGVTSSETKLTTLKYKCDYCSPASESILSSIPETEAEPVAASDSVEVGVPVSAGEPVKRYSINYTLPNGKSHVFRDTNNQWWVMETEQWSKLSFIKFEQYNSKNYVQLKHEQGLIYLVPYEGGLWYYWGNVGGKAQWVAVDTIMPTVKYEE